MISQGNGLAEVLNSSMPSLREKHLPWTVFAPIAKPERVLGDASVVSVIACSAMTASGRHINCFHFIEWSSGPVIISSLAGYPKLESRYTPVISESHVHPPRLILESQ